MVCFYAFFNNDTEFDLHSLRKRHTSTGTGAQYIRSRT